ncbi:uncharacterized protein LOC111694970 isoform X2 [Eurytemora carolleeae]|uniref:uncharacterized protein LOC111694970 isoform X2 n=1 Tax=Eurytemora carolleeae TaxID=1294199 RepID=UPI000C76C8D8|nr:uncharacterized protein LOC111694970 isoform X2 [Eurytemora carolleeae]|eukprot:XP_023319838.1 uncharacterized protein LOC111694970 isoform X2 [Eurytemora affinis]
MFIKLALVASFVLLTEGLPKKLPVINIHLYLGKDGDVKTATSTDQSLDKIPSGENRASCLGIECSSSPNRAASTMELVCCGYIDNQSTPEPEREFGGDYSDDSGSSENNGDAKKNMNNRSSANDEPGMNEEAMDKTSANDSPAMNEEATDKTSANDAQGTHEEAMDKTSANDAPAMNEEVMDKTSANDAPPMNKEVMDKTSANDAPAMNEEDMDKTSANDSTAMNEESNNGGYHSDMKDESVMENEKDENISERTGSDVKGDGMTHMSEDASSAEKPRGSVEKNRGVDTEMVHDEKVAARLEMSKGEKAALCEGIVCTGENRPNKYISSICCLNK